MFPGDGGLHVDSEFGELDGAARTQTQRVDERETQVQRKNNTPMDSTTAQSINNAQLIYHAVDLNLQRFKSDVETLCNVSPVTEFSV